MSCQRPVTAREREWNTHIHIYIRESDARAYRVNLHRSVFSARIYVYTSERHNIQLVSIEIFRARVCISVGERECVQENVRRKKIRLL